MNDQVICALCDRPLGAKTEKHHVIPKSKGGKETVEIHPICHRKIHRVFSRTDLAGLGTIEALKGHPDIETFVQWLQEKSPDFYRKTR